ncbi:hypothetical protein D3C86_1591700 [compost metagenome]
MIGDGELSDGCRETNCPKSILRWIFACCSFTRLTRDGLPALLTISNGARLVGFPSPSLVISLPRLRFEDSFTLDLTSLASASRFIQLTLNGSVETLLRPP